MPERDTRNRTVKCGILFAGEGFGEELFDGWVPFLLVTVWWIATIVGCAEGYGDGMSYRGDGLSMNAKIMLGYILW